jgi:hypothetical protein
MRAKSVAGIWTAAWLVAHSCTSHAAESSLRCEHGGVSVGDAKIDLLGKCGWPTLQESHREERADFERSSNERGGLERRVIWTVEKWTYNFGPEQLLRYVTLESGRVVRIEQGNYGFVSARAPVPGEPPPIPRAQCDPLALRLGETAVETAARCGPPALKEVREELLTEVVARNGEGATERSRSMAVELWTYDFGPDALIRFLEIRQGWIVEIAIGSYGYSH